MADDRDKGFSVYTLGERLKFASIHLNDGTFKNFKEYEFKLYDDIVGVILGEYFFDVVLVSYTQVSDDDSRRNLDERKFDEYLDRLIGKLKQVPTLKRVLIDGVYFGRYDRKYYKIKKTIRRLREHGMHEITFLPGCKIESYNFPYFTNIDAWRESGRDVVYNFLLETFRENHENMIIRYFYGSIDDLMLTTRIQVIDRVILNHIDWKALEDYVLQARTILVLNVDCLNQWQGETMRDSTFFIPTTITTDGTEIEVSEGVAKAHHRMFFLMDFLSRRFKKMEGNGDGRSGGGINLFKISILVNLSREERIELFEFIKTAKVKELEIYISYLGRFEDQFYTKLIQAVFKNPYLRYVYIVSANPHESPILSGGGKVPPPPLTAGDIREIQKSFFRHKKSGSNVKISIHLHPKTYKMRDYPDLYDAYMGWKNLPLLKPLPVDEIGVLNRISGFVGNDMKRGKEEEVNQEGNINYRSIYVHPLLNESDGRDIFEVTYRYHLIEKGNWNGFPVNDTDVTSSLRGHFVL